MANITAKSYTTEGKESKSLALPEAIFGLPWNADLVHQVATSMLSDMRVAVAHTKTRGDVRGGGKKPWKQKGTGRARHGSTRSPIWVGGGVAHGPRNDKNYSRKVNRKMKAKALFTILSKKLKDGEVLFVDALGLKEAKTKLAKVALESLSKIQGFEMLSKKTKNAAFIAIDDVNQDLKRAFRNMGNVMVDEFRNINPLHILEHKYLVIESPEKMIAFLENKLNDAASSAIKTVGAAVKTVKAGAVGAAGAYVRGAKKAAATKIVQDKAKAVKSAAKKAAKAAKPKVPKAEKPAKADKKADKAAKSDKKADKAAK